MSERRPKSLAIAYSLFVIFGFQGVHQFYLGRYVRGLLLAFLIHGPIFWFAYLEQQTRTTGEPMTLIPALLILFGLLSGLGMWIYDLFTLRRQL